MDWKFISEDYQNTKTVEEMAFILYLYINSVAYLGFHFEGHFENPSNQNCILLNNKQYGRHIPVPP